MEKQKTNSLIKLFLLLILSLGLASCSSSTTKEADPIDSNIVFEEEAEDSLDVDFSEDSEEESLSEDNFGEEDEFDSEELSAADGDDLDLDGDLGDELESLDDEEALALENVDEVESSEDLSFEDFDGASDGELDVSSDLDSDSDFDSLSDANADLDSNSDETLVAEGEAEFLEDLDLAEDSKENLNEGLELDVSENSQSQSEDVGSDLDLDGADVIEEEVAQQSDLTTEDQGGFSDISGVDVNSFDSPQGGSEDFADIQTEDFGSGASDTSTSGGSGYSDINGGDFSSDVSSNKVVSVDYLSNRAGGSFVVSTSSMSEVSSEFIPETNQFIVELPSATMSPDLRRPFLTKDFKQSFKSMNSYQEGDKVKFVFKLFPNSYPNLRKTENGFVLEPGLPQSDTAVASSYGGKIQSQDVAMAAEGVEDFILNNNKFVGKPISIQAKDESIVNVINFISEQAGANIVVSESVTGNISIKLKQVPWDQALVVIMKARALGYVRSGNVLRIASLDELKKESLAAAEVKKAKRGLAPFHVKVFPLSYAKPSTIEAKVKPFLTLATEGVGAGGQVISEERSSSLIVRDTFEVINSVASLIKELDRPPLQVLIQAKIIEASKRFVKEFESVFNISANTNSAGSGGLSGNANATLSKNGFVPNISISGIDFLGTLTENLRLKELESKVRVLSSPSVMAMNNEKATIVQADQVLTPIRTPNDNSTVPSFTFERNNVELRMEVTPQVSSDGNIIMDLLVKREFPEAPQEGVSPISSREAKTKVIVGNNRTAMIGGVYQILETKIESGTPVLRKIPLLKWLFSGEEYTKIDTELVIFITPKVINKSLSKSQAALSKAPVKASSASEAGRLARSESKKSLSLPF